MGGESSDITKMTTEMQLEFIFDGLYPTECTPKDSDPLHSKGTLQKLACDDKAVGILCSPQTSGEDGSAVQSSHSESIGK